MNAISCQVANLLAQLCTIYTWVLIVYALLSWVPELAKYQRYLEPIVMPLLRPLQRVIPPMGGFDLSFIVLILVIQIVVRPLLLSLAGTVCGI